MRLVERHGSIGAGPRLDDARVVVAGGRGLQGPDGFSLLERLAEAIGDAAVGATRPVVDAGWAPFSMQIGQTGKTVRPDVHRGRAQRRSAACDRHEGRREHRRREHGSEGSDLPARHARNRRRRLDGRAPHDRGAERAMTGRSVTLTGREVQLVAYPRGEVETSDFRVVEVPVPEPGRARSSCGTRGRRSTPASVCASARSSPRATFRRSRCGRRWTGS